MLARRTRLPNGAHAVRLGDPQNQARLNLNRGGGEGAAARDRIDDEEIEAPPSNQAAYRQLGSGGRARSASPKGLSEVQSALLQRALGDGLFVSVALNLCSSLSLTRRVCARRSKATVVRPTPTSVCLSTAKNGTPNQLTWCVYRRSMVAGVVGY